MYLLASFTGLPDHVFLDALADAAVAIERGG